MTKIKRKQEKIWFIGTALLKDYYKAGHISKIIYSNCVIILTDLNRRSGWMRNFVPYSDKCSASQQVEYVSKRYYKLLGRDSSQKAYGVLVKLGYIKELVGPKFGNEFKEQNHGRILQLRLDLMLAKRVPFKKLDEKRAKAYRDWLWHRPLNIDSQQISSEQAADFKKKVHIVKALGARYHIGNYDSVTVKQYKSFCAEFDLFLVGKPMTYCMRMFFKDISPGSLPMIA